MGHRWITQNTDTIFFLEVAEITYHPVDKDWHLFAFSNLTLRSVHDVSLC